MVLCLLPVTALAASNTGHQISVKIYKVVLDSSKPLGYQNPELRRDLSRYVFAKECVILIDKQQKERYNNAVIDNGIII